MRILVAEDDAPLAEFLRQGLEAEGHAVAVAADGVAADRGAAAGDYELLILDLNLPGASGIEVLDRVRRTKPSLPVLVLTARSDVEDRVKVLDQGADDYLTKPFSFPELSARVRALARRRQQTAGTVLRVEDLELDRVDRIVKRSGRAVELTPKEFALLECLMRQAPRTVSRATIVEQVWNLGLDSMTNVVDVYINYLRKKIDGGEQAKLIHTVRGLGYRIGRNETAAEDAPPAVDEGA